MLAYKECLPCPPAAPLDGLADVNVKVIEEREKRPRGRAARVAEPPPKPKPVAPEQLETKPQPVIEAREMPAPPVHHAEPQAEEPHKAAPATPRDSHAPSSMSVSARTRNLMIVLVLAAVAFAGSQYFFNYSGGQLSDSDASSQMKSNTQMVKMGILKYQRDQKRYPTSPGDVNGALAELHMTLTSPFTGKPIKVVGPTDPAEPGDILYESDGTHYKIRLEGKDKKVWMDNGQEFAATDAGQLF